MHFQRISSISTALLALCLYFVLTGALATLVVGFQSPALVAGALDGGFLLDAALTTLQVLGAEALDLAGLVIRAELHAGRAGAQDALAGGDGAVMAAAAVLHRAQVCGG